jgi:hypothetical protein
MNKTSKLKLLNSAKQEFTILEKQTLRKARFFKFIDLFFKCVIAILGALVAYSSDNGIPLTYMKAFGIVITGISAISSVFTLEKRSHSNMQVYSKCKSVIPELEEKIAEVEDSSDSIVGQNQNNNDIHEYLKTIFSELAKLSLASFTDSTFGKINASQREL